MAKQYRDISVIGVFALLVAALFAMVMSAAQFVRWPVSELILLEQRGLYPMESTMLAKLGYAGVLLCLGMAATCSILGLRRFGFSEQWASGVLRPLLVCVPILAVLLSAPVSLPFLGGACLSIAAWVYLRHHQGYASRWARIAGSLCASPLLALGTLFYLAATVFMPLWLPIVASSGAQLVSMQNHYAGFMPGMDLVTGVMSLPVGVLNYGLGPAVAIASTRQLLRVFGTGASDLVQVVKVAQFLPLILIALITWKLKPGTRIGLFTLLLVVTPSMSLLATGIFYPNLLGLRFVPFFVAVLVMLSATSARGRLSIVCVSFVAALLVMFARETGLVSSLALLVFCALREFQSERRAASLIRCVGFFASVFCTTLVVFLTATKGLSNAPTDPLVSSLPLIFASDFGGILSWPSPFAIGVVFVASFSVYRAFVRAGSNIRGRWDAYQAGVGVLMLGWLLYYVNRVHEFNLYAQGGLLVLLIAPRASASALRLISLGSTLGRGYVAIVATLLAGMVSDRLVATVVEADDALFRVRVTAPLQGAHSGMRVSPVYESDIEEQLHALTEKGSVHDYLVLSHLSVEVRLMGFNEGFPWYDTFSDILTVPALERVSTWIDSKGPRYLLVDDPHSRLSLDAAYQTAQLQRIVGGLRSYRKESTGRGWVLYVRSP